MSDLVTNGGELDIAPLDVWLVEDNDLFREGVEALIGGAVGMRCSVSVRSCEEALAALESHEPPDIVLMDIGLPGASGIEGTRRFREIAPASRVLMLTVHEEDVKVFEAIRAGASGYLLKPTPAAEILDALRQVSRGAAPINGQIARRVLAMLAQGAPRSDEEIQLTDREREVLQLLVEGMAIKEVANRLDISFHTANTHVRNVYEKLHVHTRSGAVARALRDRLVRESRR